MGASLGAVRDGGNSLVDDGSEGGGSATSTVVRLRRLLSAAAASPSSSRSSSSLGAQNKRPPTSQEMDAEWDAILANDDNEDDADDDDDDEDWEDEEDDDGVSMTLSDEELLSTDAMEGGDLDGSEEEQEEGEGGRGTKRVWYASYKERMKAEKAKEAAWQEKRKSMPKKHLEYLDEAQKNREIAAAR